MIQAELDQNLTERIRTRAYELYSQRAKGDGHDMDDWLQAEEEIVRGTSRHWAWRHAVENPTDSKK
jgi:Protein of unknown function (DUF2934)